MLATHMKIEELDENWITPAALADLLGVGRSTVSSWITREKIRFILLPGATHRRHLVDKRTAPAPGKAGRPKKA
jgi:excisionase family DNA binding protein